ncbi:MMPL family transporter [Patescibacteria group bacterium]|nr:MMPL family transporter [Patescibacteria group bacterium]
MSNNKISKKDLEHIGFRFFGAAGRFSVKFRWLVLIFWVLVTVLAAHFLPSLSSAVQSNNSNFLPASAPIENALKISQAFGNSTNVNPIPVVIATTNGQKLTAHDLAIITRLQSKLDQVPELKQVKNAGLSSDGQADELIALVKGSGSIDPTITVDNMQTAIAHADLPSGMQAALAGDIVTAVDNSKTTGASNSQLEIGSAIFIIILLLLIFRAPLAPIITLIPPLLVATMAGPIIAELARNGLKVSSFTELLLTVLIVGAGTDYGLFLIFRVREEIMNGLPQKEAIVKGLSRVGESITFSAATVIAALLSLMLATFELYSDLGGPLAIGIALILLAGLTLLPALLAIFGRAAFWPYLSHKHSNRGGFWGRISASVVQRPALVLIIGVLVFGGLAAAVSGYKAAGFGGNTTPPAGSEAARGNAILARHFPSSSANPTGVLFVLPQSLWQNPLPLVSLQQQLSKSPEFNSVDGPLSFNGARLSPTLIKLLYSKIGPPNHLPQLEPSILLTHGLPPGLYQAYRGLADFISVNGKIVQYEVGLSAGNPNSTAAMNDTPAMRARVKQIAANVGAINNGIAGEAPALYDINHISNSDLVRVIPIAIIVIGLLLALLLRSLIAPLYLIVSVGLSYLAAFGLSVILFITIAGESGITFILPFLMFIFLLALGEDYNILVMTRIREEAHGLTLKKAVSKALTTTGTTVTSAGLVLAGTFAVLAFVAGSSDTQVRDIGAGLSLGILMDTFLVRTLLVPSIVVLLGKLNWWPSKHGSWVEDESK